MGADPYVAGLALLTVVMGLLGFVALGACNLGSWVALFYILGNVLVALFAKTLMGQRLESHLWSPAGSFLALAITGFSLLAALFLVRRLRVGRVVLRAPTDPNFLALLSWSCFGLGLIFWMLNRSFQDPAGLGFGGFTLFRDLLLMAVIARTAMLLKSSGDRRALDGWLVVIMICAVLVGLVDNSKTASALPVVSHFATVLFFRNGLPLRTIAVLAAGTIVFLIAVAPMVHALRAAGQQALTTSERVQLVIEAYSTILKEPEELDRMQRIAAGQFKNGYYSYFGESGAGQMILGRYAAVQQIDPVISEVDRRGPRGGKAVWPGLLRQVPRIIYPDKPRYGEAFETLVHYDLVQPFGGKFPTLPLAGQAYAAYGLFGLLFIPFVTFFGFFLVVKKLGWKLYQNIYGVFFLCSFVVVYANQGDFGQYTAAAVRNFPLFTLVFFLLSRAYRIQMRRSLRGRRLHSDPVG